MGIDIKQETSRQFKKPKGIGYYAGVPLGVLLDYLTELQANGVPDDACITTGELWSKATWVEKR